jgi:hypothetical protein
MLLLGAEVGALLCFSCIGGRFALIAAQQCGSIDSKLISYFLYEKDAPSLRDLIAAIASSTAVILVELSRVEVWVRLVL